MYAQLGRNFYDGNGFIAHSAFILGTLKWPVTQPLFFLYCHNKLAHALGYLMSVYGFSPTNSEGLQS